MRNSRKCSGCGYALVGEQIQSQICPGCFRFFYDIEKEEKIMAKYFVLINVEWGSEEQVIKQLKTLKNILCITPVFGVYDLVISIEDQIARARDSIQQIKEFDNVRAIMALPTIP